MDQYTHDLLKAAKEGNIDAFEHIYHMFKDKVYAVSLSTLKNPQDAEDATQQTFMRVYEKLDTLNDLNAFNTWIQRIAINESNMILRKRKGDVSIDDETNGALVEMIEDDFMLPQEYIERDDLSLRLREIIDDLPAVQRQALVLQVYSNMSTAEIAQIMDCSENTVKSRLRYAKAHIKTEVEERERKSGEKFYGTIFFPFGYVFTRQVQSQSMSPVVSARIWNVLNSYIYHYAGGAAANAAAGTAAKAGLSLGAKIAIGAIAGTLIIGGAIFGILYGMAQSKNPESPESVIATEAVAESATQVPTEAPTEPPTEAPTEPDYSEAYASYLEVLYSSRSQIKSYEQGISKHTDSGYTVRPVAFADVYGDSTPEMIFIHRISEVDGTLNIVTVEDGVASIIYTEENFATEVSQGPGYFLFTEDNTLYASSANGGQYTDFFNYYRFDPDSSGKLKQTEVLYGCYALDGAPTSSSARINGENASLQDFENERDTLLSKADKCLMAYAENVLYDSAAKEQLSKLENVAMTFDEAIAFLKGQTGSDDSSSHDSNKLALLPEISGVYVSMSLPTGRGGHEITSDGTHITTIAIPTDNGVSETRSEDTITEVFKSSDTVYRFTCVDDSGNSYTHSVYYPGTSIDEMSVNMPEVLLTEGERSSGVLSRKLLITEGELIYVWKD